MKEVFIMEEIRKWRPKIQKTCLFCQTPFITRDPDKLTCCHSCSQKYRFKRDRDSYREERICEICGKSFTCMKRESKPTCGRSCAARRRNAQPGFMDKFKTEEHAERSRANLLKWRKENPDLYQELISKISKRMKEDNPSCHPEVIEKARTTKAINGSLHIWKGKRGGNGQLTMPQILLARSIGWDTEVAISLGPKQPGYPTCYKVDIGNPILKIAIEVDGNGHNESSIKSLDLKKEAKLKELGWRVLRFTNQEIMTDISLVLSEIEKKIKDMSISMTSR